MKKTTLKTRINDVIKELEHISNIILRSSNHSDSKKWDKAIENIKELSQTINEVYP